MLGFKLYWKGGTNAETELMKMKKRKKNAWFKLIV